MCVSCNRMDLWRSRDAILSIVTGGYQQYQLYTGRAVVSRH
jgi:hypothetical protein